MRPFYPTKPTPRFLALLLALFGAVALLVGCRFWAVQPKTGTVAADAAIPAGSAIPADSRGELRLRILWPDRDLKGFRAAAIPTSTNALVLRISKGSDEIVRKLISRPADGSPNDVSLKLDAASNLSVEVKAYREVDPDLATATPIARGTAIINIRASRATSQTLKLDALFAPTITALSANAGAAGDTITLTGENLGLIGTATPAVTFNGVTASVSAQVTPVDATKLSVTVPQGAAVGSVVVTGDGIPSTSNAVYWVTSDIKIDAPKAAWDDKPDSVRVVLIATALLVQATPAWILTESATESTYGTAPLPTWKLSGTEAGTVSESGLFLAGGAFREVTISGALGSLVSNSLKLSVQDLQVVMSPATGAVGQAGESSIHLNAFNLFSDGSTNSLVAITSANPDLVALSGSSAVSGTAAWSGYGDVEITCTPVQDGRRRAKSVITLTNYVVETMTAKGFSRQAVFNAPLGIAVDSSGSIFVADQSNHRIRMISPDGVVTTVAGSGEYGHADGGPKGARFYVPTGIALDGMGNLVVADYANNRVRMVARDGTVSTLAGNGEFGIKDGPALSAVFAKPLGVAIDATGDIFVADTRMNVVRRIRNGNVYTLAGFITPGFADGRKEEARFSSPCGLAVDAEGAVIVADTGNFRIRKVKNGQVSTIAGTGTAGSTDGPVDQAAFSIPCGIAADKDGTIFVADGSRIRTISSGTVTTLAGSTAGFADGKGAAAQFNEVGLLAVAPDGGLIAADVGNNRIRRVQRDGTVSTVAGANLKGFTDGVALRPAAQSLSSPHGITVDAGLNIFVAEYWSHRIRKFNADGTLTTFAGSGQAGFKDGSGESAQFDRPYDVQVDVSGNVFVSEFANHRIRRITPDRTVSTWAGTGEAGYSDGSRSVAKFNYPARLALDLSGNLLVADELNNRIRRVSANDVTTLAGADPYGYLDGPALSARFNVPCSVSVDSKGAVYIGEYGAKRVRKLGKDGLVAILAGGDTAGFVDAIGSSARFNFPMAVAVDANENVLVADRDNSAIRRISPDGTVRTLSNPSTGSIDGTIAIATFNKPHDIKGDGRGNFYVADYGNNVIRRLRRVP